MRLPLDLSRHCIGTEIRRLYNASIMLCIRDSGQADALEHEIQSLKQALETLDFAALRAAYPELRGGSCPTVYLVVNGEGRCEIEINGVLKSGIQR
jgi:hypothetical protein